MSKATKWLIAATSLIVTGLIIFSVVMTVFGWDFTKLSTEESEENTYEINEDFNNISINISTADIIFALSNDGICRVTCDENKNSKYSVDVKDGTLTVSENYDRKWYLHIGISFDTYKLKVFLPKTEYASLSVKESTGDIKIPKDFKFSNADISVSTGSVDLFPSVTEQMRIKINTGDVKVSNISAGMIDISTSTGKVTVSDVLCKSIVSKGSTGDILLKNVNAEEMISVKRSTGGVSFEKTDAGEIFVTTSTGDVTGSLLSEKEFITKTSTGTVSVPKTSAGGKCEIVTSTGDIIIKIP